MKARLKALRREFIPKVYRLPLIVEKLNNGKYKDHNGKEYTSAEINELEDAGNHIIIYDFV